MMRANTLMIAIASLSLPTGAMAQMTSSGDATTSGQTTTSAGPATGPAATATQTAPTDGTADQAATTAAQAGVTQAATAADVTVGAQVFDASGGSVGKIEKVSEAGAVIATGAARVQVPVTSFAKNERGLVISMTKAELEAAAGNAG